MNKLVVDVYEVVKQELGGFSVTDENTIIELVGTYGLDMLLRYRLIENYDYAFGKRWFALCENERRMI